MAGRRQPAIVPAIARAFLRTVVGRGRDEDVRRFHRWLEQQRLSLSTVVPADLERLFTRPFGKPIKRHTRWAYRSGLYPYLDWLHAQGRLHFSAQAVRPCAFPLPELAQQFLAALAVMVGQSSCQSYRNALRAFHRWLDHQSLDITTLTRQVMLSWLTDVKARGLRPITRIHILTYVRVYLRWLAEHGALPHHPDDLLRRADFPKPPRYLPRPLPPDVDREIQQRLAQSGGRYDLGLLLMRKTGLRLGELIALDYDCVRADLHDRRFLKVPLGKLDSERLVPMDDRTIALVRRLQRMGSRRRSWLLESPKRKRTRHDPYRHALKQAAAGLPLTDGPVTPHRLRHTYATELLSAGMSLLGVMKLLGHRDFRMTLRYTAITLEGIGKEYRDAIGQLEKKYDAPARITISDAQPVKMLSDVVAWIQNHLGHDPRRRALAAALVKRLLRVRDQLASIHA